MAIKNTKSKLASDKVEINKLIKQIDSDNKKLVCVFGKSGDKKSKTLSSLIQYKKNIDTCAIKSISYLKAGNENNLIADIILLIKESINEEHLPPLKNQRFLFFKHLKRKKLISKCKKEFDEIENSIENQDQFQKVKNTLPVLNTISAFGISLGVPLLSLALFRVNEIIATLSANFYYILIGICIVLVSVAIFTTVYFLISTVRNNKKFMLVSNISDSLEKFILKWFFIEEKYLSLAVKTSKKEKKIKFNLNKCLSYFYNEINYKDDNYESILRLMKNLLILNNNVFFTITFDGEQDFKLIKKNHLDNFLMTFDISRYKNRGNNNELILIILERITSITNINAKKLFQNNQIFANNLRFFLNSSDSNLNFINFLNNLIKYLNVDKSLSNNENVIDYFVSYITILIFYTMEKELCTSFLYEVGQYFNFNVDSTLFNNLKIPNMLMENLNKFKNNALIYNANYLMDTNFFNEITNNIVNGKITKSSFEEIQKNIIDRGFVKDKHFSSDFFDGFYINQYNEKLFLKKISNDIDESLFNLITLIKQKCKDENAQFICLTFKDKAIFFQNNLDSYEILEDFFN